MKNNKKIKIPNIGKIIAGSSNSVEVKKPKVLKSIKIKNWKGLIINISKSFFNLVTLNWDKVVKSIPEVIKHLGLETTEDELAWLLISKAMLKSIHNFIDNNRNHLPPNYEEDFNFTIKNLIWDTELNCNFKFDLDFIMAPEDSIIVKNLQKFMIDWFILCGKVNKKKATDIVAEFPAFFTVALNNELHSSKDFYNPLTESFKKTLFSNAAQSTIDWINYRNKLIAQVEEPLLGEPYSLSQLYIPLNAYYFDENNFATTTQIDKYLLNWVNICDKNNDIKIISGGPGSGKSSLAKMFAKQLALKHKKVLYIPLHLIDIDGENVIKAINNYLNDCGFNNFPLDNPNDLTVIFDGLDELTLLGGTYIDAAKKLVIKIQKYIHLKNYSRFCVRALFAGRTVVSQSLELYFNKSQQQIFLLPYCIPKEERNQYNDDNGLLQNDLRNQWWINYGKLTSENYKSAPNFSHNKKIEEISSQPLLNYLLALVYCEKPKTFFENTNINKIYSTIVDKVYRRGYEPNKLFPNFNISPKDFFQALETIAVAAWHEKGRTVTLNEISSYNSTSEFKLNLNSFQNNSKKNGALNMLAMFYFRQVKDAKRRGDELFEFTHNSFREYLTATRITSTLNYIQENFFDANNDQNSKEKALFVWYRLCSKTAMDSDLFEFLKNEIALKYATNPDLVLKWQTTLCKLIELVASSGYPLEKNFTDLFKLDTLKNTNNLTRNAEEALLVVHSACANSTNECLFIDWNYTTAGEWLMRLRGQRTTWKIFLYSCLNHLYLSNCDLMYNDFSTANFFGANLTNAKLYNSDLTDADFTNATLINTNLDNTNLLGATFNGANTKNLQYKGAKNFDFTGAVNAPNNWFKIKYK